MTFGELLAHSLHPRFLWLEGDFVLWVSERLDETTLSDHSDLQVCAPASLSILAVLETWLVSAGFLCGLVEFIAGEHFLESFKGSDLLVYSLLHADCKEQKQVSVIEPI